MSSTPFRTVTVHLHCSSSSSPTDTVAIEVDGGSGVDLARVGLALGLDPASVCPNGYFLSRGPGHVCSAVTWRALLAFFAKRGLPTGTDAAAPVVVHDKPAAPTAQSSDATTLGPKRKSGVEVERCPKKSKPQENKSALPKRRHNVLSDEIILGLKRRLRLDDPIPAKKIKQVECGSETQQPVKFSCGFVNANGKWLQRSSSARSSTPTPSCAGSAAAVWALFDEMPHRELLLCAAQGVVATALFSTPPAPAPRPPRAGVAALQHRWHP